MENIPSPAAVNTADADAPTPVAANPDRPLSFGEKAVGLTFNPSGDPEVYACKAGFARLIDQMQALRDSPDTPAEAKRHASIAITEMESAQMRAVKAITWKA